ncbi:MAG: ABC transporter permease [Gammaproteobacteria bacterium]|nr:ABC transporter permease [Gammaproteobacteria bacterium]
MIKSSYYFFRDIIDKRSIIIELVKRDVQRQYMGSYLGIVWLFLQPLMFISILYAVFTFGFRSGATTDMPFSIYLVTGMVAWIHFASNFNANTNVISSYSFLVKKVDFRLSILPIVQMLSSLFVHVFLVIATIVLAWYEGYAPTLYTFQIIYYLCAMSALLLGLGWLTSSTSIFVKDVSNVVSVFVQFGFWLTPIFWNINMIPERHRWIVELNPMYYIITGYRDSIVRHVPFWERELTLYFWAFALVFLYVGITVYRKLRPHFAEVI